MKKIFCITYFVLVFLFSVLFCSCTGEGEPYVMRVGERELMVQSKDLGAGDRSTALTMCYNSTVAGFTDWRLPTENELMILYNNRKSIGGFLKRPYWCSTKYNGDFSYIDFKNGKLVTGRYLEEHMGQVRAVRTIAK